MQKLQKWEAASASDWSVAVEREAVIQPLAEQKQLSIGDVDDAMSRLGMSRSFLYKLTRVDGVLSKNGMGGLVMQHGDSSSACHRGGFGVGPLHCKGLVSDQE